jgi:hypothetical protein
MRQFVLAVAAVAICLGLALAVGGCRKPDSKNTSMDDGKMSTAKSDAKMSDGTGKMDDPKMGSGKMDDPKMGTGKMDDPKKGKM